MKNPHFKVLLFPIFFILYESAGNLSNDMYLPSFLQISHDLNTHIDFVQTTLTSWFLGISIAQILLGPISDRFGRRSVLIGGGVFFLLSSAFCAISSNIEELIISRFFQGFSVGSLMLSGYSVIHELYEDHKATLIQAWVASVGVISPMIGPLLGSFVLIVSSWRAIFWILFFIGLIALFVLYYITPETLPKEKRHALHPVSILKSYGNLFKNWGFVSQSLVVGLFVSGMILWITAAPYLIMSHFGHSPQTFGYMQIPIFGGFILGAQSIRFLIGKLTKQGVIKLGIILVGLGALSLLIYAFLDSLVGLIVCMSIYSVGLGLADAPLIREALTSAGHGIGKAMSLFFLIMFGSSSLISFIVSLLPSTSFAAGGLLFITTLIGVILYLLRAKNKVKQT